MLNYLLHSGAIYTHFSTMNRLKMLGERKRINISMAKAVREIANILMRGRPGGGKFSGLLEALVLEEYDRQRYEVDKSIAALMQENLKLKAKLKEKDERLKRERRELSEALALCEADLKQARSSPH
jgi:hypothetical protein